MAQDVCSTCNQSIDGTVYLFTDKATSQTQVICSNCITLPRCFICSLPVKPNKGVELSDGRQLCARDGKTAVLTAPEAQRIATEIRDDLDKRFSRYTAFPTNVIVTVLDRIDVDQMFQPGGYDFESPNLLGCIMTNPRTVPQLYMMRLLTGLPLVELQATAAHEYTHAWIGDNVSLERRSCLSRNAEEGFCELVAYLLMDFQNQNGQKKFTLLNHYTRGQVDLFIAAEQHYGFDQILDWMQYGVSAELRAGHLEEIRDVKMPPPPLTAKPDTQPDVRVSAAMPASVVDSVPKTIKLQGVLWARPPVAIINRQTVHAGDRFTVKINGFETTICCLEIRKDLVRLEKVISGEKINLTP